MIEFTPSQLPRLSLDRLSTYRRNLDFYNGTQWENTSRNRQLVFNYSKVAIDKITSFLMHGLSFAAYPTSDTVESKQKALLAEARIKEVYQDNNLQQLDWETEVDTAILGDGCYKVFYDEDEQKIRVSSPDVSGIFAWWLGDDVAKVWRVASRYTLTQDEVELLYKTKPLKKTANITELWTKQNFQLWLDNDKVEDKPNPYGFIPFIIFPNLREPKKFWGTSDIDNVIQPQRELNRALSQLSRILELSGNPIAVLENIGSAEDIKVKPGAVWVIPEDAKAYLLDLLQGGGIRLHIDFIDLIYRCLHDISECPRAAYGGTERDLSGAALRVELGSLVQKVTRKRTIRTGMYHQRNDMILNLAKKYYKEDFSNTTHRVIWGPILPEDTDRAAQNEQLLVQSGIHSRRTAMDELGIQDPETEFKRWLEERATIRKQNIDLPFRSTRGGSKWRAEEAASNIDDEK